MAAMIWMFAAFPRPGSQRCAALAANACVAALALLAAALALTVAIEHPDAFEIAHEALAQPGPLAHAVDPTGLLVRQPADSQRATRSQSLAAPQAAAGTDCAPAERTPRTAPAPAPAARELGDYPSMPLTAADAVTTIA
jgi:hypothetical protein